MIIAVIPARSGSKGIKDKNIINYQGKPLIAWTIEQGLSSKHKPRVIVSTDSNEYANIALQYGAEIPYIRPPEISQDLSTDYEFIKHMIDMLKLNDDDIIVHLRPTSPSRTTKQIDEAIDMFLKYKDTYTSLRSVVKVEKSPYKMYTMNNNTLKPLFSDLGDIKEPYNKPRQILPDCYIHNGYIDIIKVSTIMAGSVTGTKILPFVMNYKETLDIDTISDLVSETKPV